MVNNDNNTNYCFHYYLNHLALVLLNILLAVFLF